MKVPNCQCFVKMAKAVLIERTNAVHEAEYIRFAKTVIGIVGGEQGTYDVLLPINYCPQCGTAYREEEHREAHT